MPRCRTLLGMPTLLAGCLFGSGITACSIIVLMLVTWERPGAVWGSPPRAFTAGSTPESGFDEGPARLNALRSDFGVHRALDLKSSEESLEPHPGSAHERPAEEIVGTTWPPALEMLRGANDPLASRLGALREELQFLLDQLTVTEFESNPTAVAGVGAGFGEDGKNMRQGEAVPIHFDLTPRDDSASWFERDREAPWNTVGSRSIPDEGALRGRLHSIVELFNEVLRENQLRERLQQQLTCGGASILPQVLREFCWVSSTAPFMQPTLKQGKTWVFPSRRIEEGPANTRLLLGWLECIDRFHMVKSCLVERLGITGGSQLADDVWGETEYPNLLKYGVAKRARNLARERLKSRGWVEPSGGSRQ